MVRDMEVGRIYEVLQVFTSTHGSVRGGGMWEEILKEKPVVSLTTEDSMHSSFLL
jgi:hypothetical protein